MNLKFIGKLLRMVQWGRDFTARIIRLHRLQQEIHHQRRVRELIKLGTVRVKRDENVEFIKSYVKGTFDLAVLMTRYNELKFWFMKTKYPHTKPIK